ncbi:MbtH family protein [Nocardia sp. NPDC060256]|uniref:MbtH family protein n=1 Tax=unclassified Nocardia TaxID=2637762 RepID=UPI0036588FA0
MSTNPFDDTNGQFHVLVNEEGQHSMWPAFAEIPPGWHSINGLADRRSALSYIEENWVDMRPRSLRAAMAADKTGE